MQSTGQTSTHERSFRSTQGSPITYVTSPPLRSRPDARHAGALLVEPQRELEPVGRERELEGSRAERLEPDRVERAPLERRERPRHGPRRVAELATARQLPVDPQRGLLAAGPVHGAQPTALEAELEQLLER